MNTTFRLLAAALVLLIVGAVVAGALLWSRVHEPYKGYAGAEQFVEIPAGAGAGEIRRRLLDAGVVRDDLTLMVMSRLPPVPGAQVSATTAPAAASS